MPLVKPNDEETQDEFIERCMGDEGMKEEFPDNDQRLAVCFAQWKSSRKSARKIEYRIFDTEVEIRADEDSPKIRGHAAVFNKPSDDLGGFVEIIEPGFFSRAIKGSDTAALWNHNADIILGRKSARTLELEEDETGLAYTIHPPSWASGYIETIKRGDVKQSSFAFSVGKNGEKWEEKDGVRTRTLLSGGCDELHDVSPVVYPAYPQTDVKVRMAAEEVDQIAEAIKNKIFPQPAEGLGGQGVPDDGSGRVDSLDLKRKRLATY